MHVPRCVPFALAHEKANMHVPASPVLLLTHGKCLILRPDPETNSNDVLILKYLLLNFFLSLFHLYCILPSISIVIQVQVRDKVVRYGCVRGKVT